VPMRAARLAVVALCAMAFSCVAAPSASLAAPARVYWGAQIGDQFTGTAAPWDMNAVSQFAQLAGKSPSIVAFGAPWADCSTSPCTDSLFPWTPFTDIRAYGAIPFLSWGSQSLPFNLNDPNFQLSDIINGSHDAYIRTFATKARDWGHPFFLRFDWEMNGDWFPWSERANGNNPGEYVAAWRHVHDIFTSVGATNSNQSLSSIYPGSSYVDWTCLDGFNWGTGPNSATHVWRSFDYLYNSTYHLITDTLAPGKPMVVGEVAASETGGSKAGWIHNMFSALPTSYPNIRGLVWLEQVANGMDWPIESSSTATSSFVSGIRNPYYAANSYSGISRTPISPPPTR